MTSAVLSSKSFLFFLVLSVTRRRPPLGQMLVGTFNHEICNVKSPKTIETLIHENVTHIVFFFVCKMYFLLVLMMFSIRSTRTCHNMQGVRHW